MNKTDLRILTRGIKLVGLGLLTVIDLLIAIRGLILVAQLSGYLAVVVFIASVVALVVAFILLLAQGIVGMPQTKGKGDSNE